ncbi:MAG: GFA family protein [Xanthomonadales bacterium]|nr:GFA family protein [Xanthomonadales bacterium]
MKKDSTETFEGGCTCRHLRYRMESEPMVVHCCHCRWCQRETGSAFVINAMIESDRLRVIEGEPEFVTIPSESGKGQRIARCPHCKIALWSHYAGLGDLASFVRVGTLDDPDRFPPDAQIFTESKQPWVTLTPDIPAFEQFYRRSELWPEASLRRREALLAKLG